MSLERALAYATEMPVDKLDVFFAYALSLDFSKLFP
jgi:hypothetical protein